MTPLQVSESNLLTVKKIYAAEKFSVKLLSRESIEVEVWDNFIAQSPQGACYAYSWYLDIVCPGWKSIWVYRNSDLMAVMPLNISKKFGIYYSLKPRYCQYLGIFFKRFTGKAYSQYSNKNKIVELIVKEIPSSILIFHQSFAPEFDYSLPFYWAGYKLETRYSYWLDSNRSAAEIFSDFDHRARTCINKAIRNGLKNCDVISIGEVMNFIEKYSRPASLNIKRLTDLAECIVKNKSGGIKIIKDEKGQIHCIILYLLSNNKCIYLIGAANPEFKTMGSMSLAVWSIIKECPREITIHDFEGSMLKPVENFFRGFGAHPVPYLDIRKNKFPKPIQMLIDK